MASAEHLKALKDVLLSHRDRVGEADIRAVIEERKHIVGRSDGDTAS